jgi:Arc/MetJ-type ribon-helix-helix transcriptional regulator
VEFDGFGSTATVKLDGETAQALRVIVRRLGAGNKSEAIRAAIRLAAADMASDRQRLELRGSERR